MTLRRKALRGRRLRGARHAHAPLPVRSGTTGLFRYEAPQSGRYRQHFQLGVEAFGSHSPALDAEVIGVLHALYAEFGLEQVELRLNSMGCRSCRQPYTDHLRAFLQARENDLCGECRERMELNPLRSFDCKVPYCREVMESAPRLVDFLCEECAEHHRTVTRHLALQDIAFVEDHRLVRGMDYYTRTTFEFQAANLGAQSGVGGGGRYDNLVESIGGPPTPGVGWGSGVERILLALNRGGAREIKDRPPTAYLVAVSAAAREMAFGLAHVLRARGVRVDLDFMMRSMKGQMKQAGRSGAAFALIVGDEELQAGEVTLRFLAEAREERLAADTAVNTIVQWEESRG